MGAVKSVIKGVGKYLPDNVVTSSDVENMLSFERLNIRKGTIQLLTGVSERRFASKDEQPSDLAAKAALNALETSGVDAKDLDVVIFCAVTTDFLEPAIANLVQDSIGAINAQCFDVKNACNAIMNGVDLADSLIRTDKAKLVLVVSGEKFSSLLKFNCKDKEEVLKRIASYSLGDGGGAFILGAEEDSGRGILNTAFESYGGYWRNNVNWGGGTLYPHEPEQFYFWGNTKNIVALGYDKVPDLFFNTIKEINWDNKSIDCFIGEQVATYITKEMTKRLGLEEEIVISILEKYGNMGAAGIPIATFEAIEEGKIKKGSKVILFGAGNGLTIGCVCLNW